MRLIIDTNVFIDLEQGRLQQANISSLQNESIFMAAITVAELLTGVKLAKTPEECIRRHTSVENILSHVPVLEFDTEVARTYAELYAYTLNQTKRSNLNVHDLQIAATALVYDYSLLTTNTSDFKGIPSLKLLRPAGDVAT